MEGGLRRSMGAAARATAEQYTIARYTQSYLAVYDEVLQERRSLRTNGPA
jgi:hypothetical protein